MQEVYSLLQLLPSYAPPRDRHNTDNLTSPPATLHYFVVIQKNSKSNKSLKALIGNGCGFSKVSD
jgi:hypothetical protein